MRKLTKYNKNGNLVKDEVEVRRNCNYDKEAEMSYQSR